MDVVRGKEAKKEEQEKPLLPSPFTSYERISECKGKLYYNDETHLNTYSDGAIGVGPVILKFVTDNTRGTQIVEASINDQSFTDGLYGTPEQNHEFILNYLFQLTQSRVLDVSIYNTVYYVVEDINKLNKHIKDGQVRYLPNGDFALG